jgi:hypothetical protein
MVARYKVTLKQEERIQLEEMTSKGKKLTARFLHAKVLLLCDAGPYGDPLKVADIAKALNITSRTIEHIKKRFVEQGMQAALERKRSETPSRKIFDGAFDAKLMALACSEAPPGRIRWTLQLLADKVVELKIVEVESVSEMTIHRSLKKTNYSRI